MTHDPLCPDASTTGGGCEPMCESCDDCQCELIAKVRADESKRKDDEIYEWRIKASDQYGHGFHEGWKRGHDAATHARGAES